VETVNLVSDQRLRDLGPTVTAVFHNDQLLPHVAIDGLSDVDLLRNVANELPKIGRYEFDSGLEIELASKDIAKMEPDKRSVIQQLNGQTTMGLPEESAGIPGLVSNQSLEGGRPHQIRRRGVLKIDAHYNEIPKFHLARWLKLFLNLNQGCPLLISSSGPPFILRSWDRAL
jgi:hypothetical protein